MPKCRAACQAKSLHHVVFFLVVTLDANLVQLVSMTKAQLLREIMVNRRNSACSFLRRRYVDLLTAAMEADPHRDHGFDEFADRLIADLEAWRAENPTGQAQQKVRKAIAVVEVPPGKRSRVLRDLDAFGMRSGVGPRFAN